MGKKRTLDPTEPYQQRAGGGECRLAAEVTSDPGLTLLPWYVQYVPLLLSVMEATTPGRTTMGLIPGVAGAEPSMMHGHKSSDHAKAGRDHHKQMDTCMHRPFRWRALVNSRRPSPESYRARTVAPCQCHCPCCTPIASWVAEGEPTVPLCLLRLE